jgi:exonuclease III
MFIGIFSWNIGENINKPVFEQIYKNIKNYGNLDILVFGFQEVPINKFDKLTSILDNITNKLEIKKSFSEITTCSGLLGRMGGFGIYLKVYYKKNVTLINSNFFCPNKTKGYTGISLKIDDLVIDIINTHMPFGSNGTEKTKKFYKSLEEWLKDNKFTSQNRILFGDLNTRSLLTKDCYKKDIELCDENNKGEYCSLSSMLEKMPFSNTNGHFVNSKKNKKTSCNIKDCSLKKMPKNNSELLELLKKSDYLGNPPNGCEVFKNYQEKSITFLPTYKRDTKNGVFKLSKNNMGRLPGFADRIIYKSENILIPKVYTSFGIVGNDHLPIYKLFYVRRKKVLGGKRTKKKVYKRSKK